MKRITTAGVGRDRPIQFTPYWRLSYPLRAVVMDKTAGDALREVKLVSTLRERNGFVYLEVPDEIIEGFMKLIPGRGIQKPEEASDPEEYVGAHISVMYAEETDRLMRRKKKIKEIGEDFEYTFDKLYMTEPDSWDEVKEVYFISVKSPQLESLRKRYDLSKLLNGHDFHISVAVRTR